MDELEDTGAFEDALSDKDSIDRELDAARSSREVDTELETLKAELGTSSGDAGGADAEAASEDADADAEVEVDDAAVEAELEELKNEDDA
jgi:phage shock protein A